MVLGIKMSFTTPSDVSLSSEESKATKTSEKPKIHESKHVLYTSSDSEEEGAEVAGDAPQTSFDDLEYTRPETTNDRGENDDEERIDVEIDEGLNGELPSSWGIDLIESLIGFT
ncbi:MAG: hypothetical protein QOH50_5253 [Kribbellaceae bacterium]|nr:hypothetical protein [Kribbellaceae bacterium]